jgi:hypothetical protein
MGDGVFKTQKNAYTTQKFLPVFWKYFKYGKQPSKTGFTNE